MPGLVLRNETALQWVDQSEKIEPMPKTARASDDGSGTTTEMNWILSKSRFPLLPAAPLNVSRKAMVSPFCSVNPLSGDTSVCQTLPVTATVSKSINAPPLSE